MISSAQHGFRQNLFCETASLRLTKELFQRRDFKQYSRVTAIDFARACDTLNLDALTARIRYISDANTTAWFKSYLTERKQSTQYCDVLSDSRQLSSSVPEGLVLAPTLFLLFINELLQSLAPEDLIVKIRN